MSLRCRLLALLAVVSLGASCSGGETRDLAEADPTTTGESTTTTEAPTTTTTQPPTTTTIPPTTTTLPPPPPPPPPPEGDILSRGMVGPRTQALQERLVAMHYDPGPVDGEFGTKTVQAVWAFQHSHGLPADGNVTPELWAAMQTATDPAPLRPDGPPDRVEISIDNQYLVVYQAGVVALITHISSGNGERWCEGGRCGVAVTPRGDFTFERHISGWRTSFLGRLYNPMYFHHGYAVHGSGSVPNHPASHGCVRIPMHIAEYFPTIAPLHVAVYVV